MTGSTPIGRRHVLALSVTAALSALALSANESLDGYSQEATPSPGTAASPEAGEGTTRARFTLDDIEIVVHIADNPTSRDFVSMLPLTLEFEDFASMEKLSYLPRELTVEGSPSTTPRNGDLIYFVPWGNLGFYYDVDRRDPSFDDRVILIGTIETGEDVLGRLECGPVHVEIVT